MLVSYFNDLKGVYTCCGTTAAINSRRLDRPTGPAIAVIVIFSGWQY